jgi:hypothetical protein
LIFGTTCQATRCTPRKWAGLKSVKNGPLLQAAESAGYDVLLTVDQGVPHQQNLDQRTISVLVIRSPTNQMDDLIPIVNAILVALNEIRPGQVAFVT